MLSHTQKQTKHT